MFKIVKHKFKSKPTEYQGIKYHSKLEASYAKQLDLRKKTGEVLFYLRQVPIHLTGNVKYVIDFVEFLSNDTVVFTEIKGYDTPMSKMKRKQALDLYPIEINVIKKV